MLFVRGVGDDRVRKSLVQFVKHVGMHLARLDNTDIPSSLSVCFICSKGNMVECPGSFPICPLLLYRHVRTGPILEVHIMSGANYEDVQKLNISHGWSVHITCCTNACTASWCVCVQSNGWRTGYQILLKLYHIVLLASK
jgi:hypothetical protein